MYIQMLEVKRNDQQRSVPDNEDRLTATEVLSRARDVTGGRAFRIVIIISTIAFLSVRAASCFAAGCDTVKPTPHVIRNSLKERIIVAWKTHPSLQHPLPQQHSPFPQQPVNTKVRRGPGSNGS